MNIDEVANLLFNTARKHGYKIKGTLKLEKVKNGFECDKED